MELAISIKSVSPGRPFRRGDPRTREAGRRGGLTTAAQRRKVRGPYKGSILDAMDAAVAWVAGHM